MVAMMGMVAMEAMEAMVAVVAMVQGVAMGMATMPQVVRGSSVSAGLLTVLIWQVLLGLLTR